MQCSLKSYKNTQNIKNSTLCKLSTKSVTQQFRRRWVANSRHDTSHQHARAGEKSPWSRPDWLSLSYCVVGADWLAASSSTSNSSSPSSWKTSSQRHARWNCSWSSNFADSDRTNACRPRSRGSPRTTTSNISSTSRYETYD